MEKTILNKRNQILENINLCKEKGLNSVSAILALQEDEKDLIEKELVAYFISEGYKVSITNGEFKILNIEW